MQRTVAKIAEPIDVIDKHSPAHEESVRATSETTVSSDSGLSTDRIVPEGIRVHLRSSVAHSNTTRQDPHSEGFRLIHVQPFQEVEPRMNVE